MRKLSLRKKVFRVAKKEDFAQWIHNEWLNLANMERIPRYGVVRCRWVLTYKKSKPDEKKVRAELTQTNEEIKDE